MLTVTDLASYDYCPRKLFINKALGLKEAPNLNTIRGGVIHKVLENWVITKKDPEALLKLEIKNKHQELKKFGQGLVDFYHEALPWIKAEADLLRNNTLKPEVSIESQELGLKGRIDLIIQGRKEIPVELKTGSSPRENEVWPAHQIQLGAYLMMLKLSEGQIHYLKDSEIRNVVLNPFLERKILKIKKSAEEMISLLNLPPTLNEDNKCSRCGFKEFCYNPDKVKQRIEMVKKGNNSFSSLP